MVQTAKLLLLAMRSSSIVHLAGVTLAGHIVTRCLNKDGLHPQFWNKVSERADSSTILCRHRHSRLGGWRVARGGIMMVYHSLVRGDV